jgi:gamma-glutamyltranspeptidase/glutathione hydrolase
MLDLQRTPAEALAGPRIHQQWSPDELMVESTMPNEFKQTLIKLGHTITEPGSMGVSQIVARTPDGRGFIGAADPRAGGTAEGF